MTHFIPATKIVVRQSQVQIKRLSPDPASGANYQATVFLEPARGAAEIAAQCTNLLVVNIFGEEAIFGTVFGPGLWRFSGSEPDNLIAPLEFVFDFRKELP